MPRQRQTARDAALGLLARREHSEAELRRKLRQRNYSAQECQQVIEALLASNLLSDERFAEEYVRSALRRGHGPMRVRASLRERGVADALVDVVLSDGAIDWAACCRQVRQRKFGEASPADDKERGRQMRFLASRGFSSAQVAEALRGNG